MKRSLLRVLAMVRRSSPVKIVFLGYLSYILVGWGLLCLPICRQADPISALDHLFIATSAVSTTGLITVNTPLAYSYWGELIVLALFQLGGLGYMTVGSFVLLARHQDLSKFREQVTRTTFALPEGFDVGHFLRNVIVFTFTVEAVGAILLFFAFQRTGIATLAQTTDIGASGSGVGHVAWQAVFHSVSAFCTAGFSLFPDSLEAFRADPWVNLIIATLSILGAVGFIVLTDAFWRFTGRRSAMTLTSHIILHATFWVILGGAVLLFLAEPTIAVLPTNERVLTAIFQSMTAMTTVGFNTHPIGPMSPAPILLLLVLMVHGASPAGTGGGIKSTSVSAVTATIRSVVRGDRQITFWGRTVPRVRLHAAWAAVGLYACTLLAGTFLLLLVQSSAHEAFADVVFEAASALGTVGLSRGITPELTALGKLVVIAMMFIGRLGPLTFGLALFEADKQRSGEQDLAV